MSPQVAHPRTLAAFRLLLVVTGVTVTVAVVTATFGFLFVVGLFGTLAALFTAESVLVPALALSGVGLVVAGSLLAGLFVGLRRVERAVVRADRVPTPVEVAHSRYVAGEMDERGLERDLEAALGGQSSPASDPGHARRTTPANRQSRLLERESSRR